MNDEWLTRDQTDAVNDRRNDFDRIGAESIFADEVADAALEAAALGPPITFTSSIILLACRFC
jgi:hypothetical protein